MATSLVFLMELSGQLRQRRVGGIDLEVVLDIGVGGPGTAAVGPWDAVVALGLPTGAFLIRYVDSYQPDLIALEDPEEVHKPLTRPDQVIGDDVDPFLQVDPDGPVAGAHGLVQEGARCQAEPLKTVILDHRVPRVIFGTHLLHVCLAWRDREPEHVDSKVHPAVGNELLKRLGE